PYPPPCRSFLGIILGFIDSIFRYIGGIFCHVFSVVLHRVRRIVDGVFCCVGHVLGAVRNIFSQVLARLLCFLGGILRLFLHGLAGLFHFLLHGFFSWLGMQRCRSQYRQKCKQCCNRFHGALPDNEKRNPTIQQATQKCHGSRSVSQGVCREYGRFFLERARPRWPAGGERP